VTDPPSDEGLHGAWGVLEPGLWRPDRPRFARAVPWLRFANVGEHNSMILGYLGFMVDISKLDGEKSTDFLEVAPPCNNGGCMSN